MDLSTPETAAAHFAQLPEAEVLYLASHAHLYPAAVGAAAVAELQRRQLLPDTAPPPTPPAPPVPPTAYEDESWTALLGPLLRGLVWPTRQCWAVPVLIDLNLLVWLAMALSGVSATAPTGHDLMRWGSNVSDLTLHGQPWRLVSSLFVHNGGMHLLLNMVSLWLLGVLLEARVGAGRLLATYLAAGVVASLTTLWYHGAINSTGASGAVFGLYGLMLALLLSRKLQLDKYDRRAMLGMVGYLVLSNLLSGLTGNIDNSAHVGGLLTGLLLAGPLVAWSLPTPAPSPG